MLYIAVVSHKHFNIINELNCLPKISTLPEVKVIVKDNYGEPELKSYCELNDIQYLDENKGIGFGANNNFIFKKIMAEASESDYFLILNPDVYIEVDKLLSLVTKMNSSNISCATINLYKDKRYTTYDNSVRKFPTLLTFLGSYLFGRNNSIEDKSTFSSVQEIEWCAGSFIILDVRSFKLLNGFDERFFMYCEDIDLCWRLKYKLNTKLYCFADIKAIHYARFNNRRLFSKHFYWHIKSICIYLTKTYFWKVFGR